MCFCLLADAGICIILLPWLRAAHLTKSLVHDEGVMYILLFCSPYRASDCALVYCGVEMEPADSGAPRKKCRLRICLLGSGYIQYIGGIFLIVIGL
jgi:hypothetical protein